MKRAQLFKIQSSFREEALVDVIRTPLPVSVRRGARSKVPQVHSKDNVLVVLTGLKSGEKVGAPGATFSLEFCENRNLTVMAQDDFILRKRGGSL